MSLQILQRSKDNPSCPSSTEENVEELRATHLILSWTELTDCYIDFPVEGRLTRRDRRVMLRIEFAFW